MPKLSELYTELTARDSGLNSALNRVRSSLEGAQKSLDTFAREGAKVFAVLSAGLGFSVKEAIDAEGAMTRLRGALVGAGESAEAARGLSDYAATLQKITVHGDDALKAVMGLGLNMGVSAGRIREVTRNAIGLAQAIGVDLQTGMRYAALAEQGQYDALSRLIPALRSANTEAEKHAVIQRLMKTGFDQATDAANTAGGSLKQLWNVVTDLAEAIGTHLLKHIQGFAVWAKTIVLSVTDWVTKNGDLIVTFAKIVIALGVLVTATLAVAKAMAIAQALSGPKGWAALAVGLAAAAGAVLLVDKAFKGVQGEIQKAVAEQERLTRETKKTAEAAKDIAVPWSSRGGASVRKYGQKDPRMVEMTGEGRGGSFVGIAELAKSMQQAVWDQEKRRLEQEKAATLKRQERLLQEIRDNVAAGEAGLMIVPG